jgi:hypothetical protein
MRATEFITERKKKKRTKKAKLSRYFFPGFAYFGGSGEGDAGGGDGGGESMYEGKEIAQEIENFVSWASKKLKLKNTPKIKLSYNTKEAQQGHHTGRHTPGDNFVWVYAKNRNLVDILRTVFHELVHVRQHELGQIKPGDSYPGSPIEAEADMLAGKYIKIYGKKHRNIFQ